jgi:hypothetical protein
MPKTAPSTPFQPSGVITLTTDFGHQDPFVGVMKGQVLCRFPAARLVDLTHEIRVHWPAEAGFWLGRSFGYFPAGTVHVAVVDPGVGSTRGIAAIEADGQLFLAPDNGLLAGVLETLTSTPILRRLDDAVLRVLATSPPSATFHGRDIFAPLAAELAAGRLLPEELGPVVAQLVPGCVAEPLLAGGQLTGAIVTVDHFGNLLTNLDAALVAQVATPVVLVGGEEILLRRTYSDVRPGEYVALINSFGVLEVARAEKSAAEGLGLGPGGAIVVAPRRG